MKSFGIESIAGREIIDSRGNPTLEVEIKLDNSVRQYASVPSGASVGLCEAVELRDCDMDRYHGMGVTKAIHILNTIIKPQIKNKTFTSLKEFDDCIAEIDGTNNKSRIGSNTSLASSIAFAKCLAASERLPLHKLISNEYERTYGATPSSIKSPTPMLNLINGGKHANNKLVLQEFMIVPTFEASISEKLRLSCEFFHDLKEVLQSMKLSTNVGDEGGFAPLLDSSHDALDLMMKVLEKSKYEKNFRIAIDAAASTFYDAQKKTYDLYYDDEPITCADVIDFYDQLLKEYPIISIEDPLSEEDERGWKEITEKLGEKIMLVGDDLFVTNVKKLQHGIDNKLGNAILIKPNQIGTLTETMMAVNLARLNNYDIIVSHRSGDTEDSSLSHIAIGLRASYIKAGAPCRSERVAKYNELIRIME